MFLVYLYINFASGKRFEEPWQNPPISPSVERASGTNQSSNPQSPNLTNPPILRFQRTSIIQSSILLNAHFQDSSPARLPSLQDWRTNQSSNPQSPNLTNPPILQSPILRFQRTSILQSSILQSKQSSNPQSPR